MQLAALRASPLTAHGQLKPERLVEPKVRKAFPDTVFWAADLRTDARGHAEARVEFPDSLTTWRATARGVTARYQGRGRGRATHRAQEPDPAAGRSALLPREDEVVISGDRAELPDGRKDGACLARREGSRVDRGRHARGQGAEQGHGAGRISVCGRRRRRTRCCSGKALTNEESDALELTLPVLPDGVPMHESKAGLDPRTSRPTREAQFAFPQDANPARADARDLGDARRWRARSSARSTT